MNGKMKTRISISSRGPRPTRRSSTGLRPNFSPNRPARRVAERPRRACSPGPVVLREPLFTFAIRLFHLPTLTKTTLINSEK